MAPAVPNLSCAQLELNTIHDLQEPVYLTDEALKEILDNAGGIKKWIESVEAYALSKPWTVKKFWATN